MARPPLCNQPDMLEMLAREIESEAEDFAAKLRKAAARARNEEDIRVAVERSLETLTRKFEITLEGRHEYTLVRGRVDSVYGCVFIEYKNPASPAARLGPTESSPGTKAVVEQIRERFTQVAPESERRGRWLLGVGCDGRFFVFCRFADGKITVEPVEVSRWSARRFLWALFNLGTRGGALTAESLARDFGHGSDLALQGVPAFCRALRSSVNEPRVEMFFRQWRILFGEVCGYDVENPDSRIAELADAYLLPGATAAEILFSLHTYYALLMKLLAARVACAFQRLPASPVDEIDRAATGEAVRERLRDLEEGGVFAHLRITNFLEGDLFSWYLSAWSEEIEKTVRHMVARLAEYNPGTLRDNSAEARDLLKQLYHQLFPRSVRHDLGEYYTPDWLAELAFERVGYQGDPDTRVLDPSCGSGTFLVLAMNRVRRWLENNFDKTPLSPSDVARRILQNIIGFDLNPLAVLAARTNYLIQLLDLFGMPGQIEIPVYLCDSILTPSQFAADEPETLLERPVEVPTSAKLFLVPREVTEDRNVLARYTQILAEYARARSGYTVDDFLHRCRVEGIPVSAAAEEQHRNLFQDIRALDGERRNGVWARFIKNAFAPVFLRSQRVDLVVGNPPWVNWESLPEQYRDAMKPVWQRYGLFSLTGGEGRLGGGKKDLSMLMLYACVDHYLKNGGKLGFVITQTVFKTKGAGDGFRRFRFAQGKRTQLIRALSVDDLSDFQPFEGAANRTAVFVCLKDGHATRYPVPYTIWRKRTGRPVRPEMPLSSVEQATEQSRLGAVPVDPRSKTSPWLTASSSVLSGLKKVMGRSEYAASAGCCTWLNGCYWIRILKHLPAGDLLIENLHDVGKIKLPRVQFGIEPDLVYPLLRGRDVHRWHAAPSAHIILTQDPKTRRGIPEEAMRRQWPKTYNYLKRFEKPLRKRSGYRKYFRPTDPFYSMYNVGAHTFAPWKVLWPEVGHTVRAAVCGPAKEDGKRPVLADHTNIGIACRTAAEAHFVAALLNSSPCRLIIRGYVVLHPSPHVLEHVAIPKHRPASSLQRRLAELSKRCHQVVHSDTDALRKAEAELDELAAQLWGISPAELRAIQDALADLEARPD